MNNEKDGMRKLHRYQTAACRAYNAAFKQLQALQGDRFSRQPSSLPEPILEDPETELQPEQEPSTGEAKIIVFTPRDMKLQSEPETQSQRDPQASRDCKGAYRQLTMCA